MSRAARQLPLYPRASANAPDALTGQVQDGPGTGQQHRGRRPAPRQLRVRGDGCLDQVGVGRLPAPGLPFGQLVAGDRVHQTVNQHQPAPGQSWPTRGPGRMTAPVRYVITCAAGPTRYASAAQREGWDTCLLATPSAMRFLEDVPRWRNSPGIRSAGLQAPGRARRPVAPRCRDRRPGLCQHDQQVGRRDVRHARSRHFR